MLKEGVVCVVDSENKRLRAEIDVLKEDVVKKNQQTSAVLDGDLKTLQFDLAENIKVRIAIDTLLRKHIQACMCACVEESLQSWCVHVRREVGSLHSWCVHVRRGVELLRSWSVCASRS